MFVICLLIFDQTNHIYHIDCSQLSSSSYVGHRGYRGQIWGVGEGIRCLGSVGTEGDNDLVAGKHMASYCHCPLCIIDY